MKYIDHLKELRKRILLSFFILIISFCFFIYNASFVGEILTKPLFDLFDDSDKKRMIFNSFPTLGTTASDWHCIFKLVDPNVRSVDESAPT